MSHVTYLTNHINLALHCLYLCHKNLMLAPHCLNSDLTMYITKLLNPKFV
jgi:hypothetical protein